MSAKIKNFEELREFIIEEKHNVQEYFFDNLEEMTQFQLGREKGYIDGLQLAIDTLRNILKYGEDIS